ncbi:hypothetical protein [Krasilnikoviella flava]|uniref:Uncharacterized protein n=1 Tax=Krasilnikoviella flava TaxID=526729 RepID=A0A1T5LQ55_9MICO|nr:hypothetical protein [Krasilnikoviella flava]SKC77689.1 hypothetical protein SAMN04324258_3649 [Krasilnikoviella flava]
MSTHQTRTFTDEVNAAFIHLDEIMSSAVREITFASLNSGVIDRDVAKAASDRVVKRAQKVYERILTDVPPHLAARQLAAVLAELTISTTTTWVVATHTAINSAKKDDDE